MNPIKIFERVLRRRSHHPRPGVLTEGDRIPDNALGLCELSRLSTREPVELVEPPAERVRVLTTNPPGIAEDEARKRAAAGGYVGIPRHDVTPD